MVFLKTYRTYRAELYSLKDTISRIQALMDESAINKQSVNEPLIVKKVNNAVAEPVKLITTTKIVTTTQKTEVEDEKEALDPKYR